MWWAYLGTDAFDNIQNGINAVATNGKVIVYTGTYNENVLVNKTVTLWGSGINSIIDGGNNNDVVRIRANGVKMFKFKVQNSEMVNDSAGINLDSVNNVEINDTYCTTNLIGI